MASIGNFILAIVILLLITVPFIAAFLVFCVVVLLFLWSMKKKAVDQMLIMYDEMIEQAIINRQSNQIELYRYPAPFFGRVMHRIDELCTKITKDDKGKIIKTEVVDKEIKEINDNLKNLEERISGQSAVFLGKIIGYNKFDMLATVEDSLMPEGIEDDPRIKEIMETNNEKRKVLEELIEECGRFINFIVYEKDMGGFWIFKKKYKQGVLAFEDQTLGLNSADGIVTLLGEGTQTLGIYFQTCSGYPQRIQVLLTHLIDVSRIRLSMLHEANIVNLTEKAANLDTQFLKLAELKVTDSAVTEKGKKE
jgi:hypothetical protein